MMTLYQQFRNKNLCVIPIKKGVPLVEWSRFFNALPPTDEVENWRGNEYALVCGNVSGIVALDIDTNEPEGNRVYELAGASPVRKKGSKGFTAFYRFNGELSTNWKRPDDKSPIVELLANKRLTTIPPSPHRKTGQLYEWMDGVGLLDEVELPTLSPDFVKLMNALYPKPQRPVTPLYDVAVDMEVNLSDAEEMLSYINPDCPRDEWISIGMALRDEFGDAACHVWHRWSEKAGSRYNHNAAQSAWRSFNGSGYSIGTIVHLAKQAGYIAQREPEATESFAVDMDYINNLYKKKKQEPLEVHGLVADIAKWITETAIRPQPVLSLAAAITFVGMVKGHRFEGATGLRTNMLVMNLAPTGGGKEHPQASLRKLMRHCGFDEQLMGEPTSGTGFLRAINDRGRVVLWVMDEMGRFLSNISHKSAGSFQREIVDYIVKTFSCANSVLKGREYADSEKNPTIDIKNPHFCCLGSTVLERFKDSVSSSEVIDGFLNRWLVMAVNDRGKRAEKVNTRKEPPADLIQRLQAINEGRVYDPYNGLPIVEEVRFSPEAWDVFVEYRDEMDDLVSTAAYPLSALYARCAEHVEKLALILCDDTMIGVQDVKAAIRVVKYSNSCIMDFAGLLSDSQAEADYLKVREIIKNNSPINKSRLTRMTQFVTGGARRRIEIINDIIETGDVTFEKKETSTIFTWIQ